MRWREVVKVWKEGGRSTGLLRMRESAGGSRQTRGETEPESPTRKLLKTGENRQ